MSLDEQLPLFLDAPMFGLRTQTLPPKGATGQAFEDFLVQQLKHAPLKHARWLNTLSMMENCGARKIARYEHPEEVTLEVLKHAAEEARHAYIMKGFMTKVLRDAKLPQTPWNDYASRGILASRKSRTYIGRIDTRIARELKRSGLTGRRLKEACYLLVTFAIEVRAFELYPAYQRVLQRLNAGFSVNVVIAEEKDHLFQMREQLKEFFGTLDATLWMQKATEIETALFDSWWRVVSEEIMLQA